MAEAAALLSLMADLSLTLFQERTDWKLMLAGLILLLLWEIIWKGFALWHAARMGKPGWFVALLLVHSAGMLPMLFLLLSRRKHGPHV